MLLAVDIGNSSVKFGLFDHDRLTAKFSIPTKRDYLASEIAEDVGERLPAEIKRAMVCSVVPELNNAISEYVTHFVHAASRFATTADDFDLSFNFPIDHVGTDRLVNASAAATKYGVPVIVISFGTATTIDAVNAKREYLGGLIAPGIKVSAQALSFATSKLPDVEIAVPDHAIATTTERAIQSGVALGHVAMVEGLLSRVIDELGDEPKVIATGGYAKLIASETGMIDVVDQDLTLEGLRMLSAA